VFRGAFREDTLAGRAVRHIPYRYQSNSQQTYPVAPPQMQSNINNYNAPAKYPQSQRQISNGPPDRKSDADRMTAFELARKQAQRPVSHEPTKQTPLRLLGSSRRNQGRESIRKLDETIITIKLLVSKFCLPFEFRVFATSLQSFISFKPSSGILPYVCSRVNLAAKRFQISP